MISMMYSTFLSVDSVFAPDSTDLNPLMNERERLRKLEFMIVSNRLYLLYIHANIFSIYTNAKCNKDLHSFYAFLVSVS
jgi:hypothetical protein